MKLKIKQTTEKEIVIGLPAFFKRNDMNIYYCIIEKNDVVCVHHTYDGEMKITQNYPINCVFDGKEEISTKAEFLTAYKTAVETINKQYQETIDDIAMLTEGDGGEPADPKEDEIKYEQHQQKL